MPRIEIPRSLTSLKNAEIKLHIFSDASLDGYGAVLYQVSQDSEEIEVSFVIAKARVTPLRSLSVPRLELQYPVLN